MIRGATLTLNIKPQAKNKLLHEPFLSYILIMKGKRKSIYIGIKVKTVQDEEKFLTQLKIHKR